MRKRKWYERMSAAVLIAVLLVNHGDMGIMAKAETITALEENLEKAKEHKQMLASYYLGLAYDANGDSDKAKKCIAEYIKSGVATSYDLYELGMQEMQDGNYKNALTYFNSGLELEKVPNKQNLMKSAIAAYEYSGDFDSAKKMMKEYLKAYPDDEEAKHENTFLETR